MRRAHARPNWTTALPALCTWDMRYARVYQASGSGSWGQTGTCVSSIPNSGWGGAAFDLIRETGDYSASFCTDPDTEPLPGPLYTPASPLFNGHPSARFGQLDRPMDVLGGEILARNTLIMPAQVTGIIQPFSFAALVHPINGDRFAVIDAVFEGGITLGYGLEAEGDWEITTTLGLPWSTTNVLVDGTRPCIAAAIIDEDTTDFHLFTSSGGKLDLTSVTGLEVDNVGQVNDQFFGFIHSNNLAAAKLSPGRWTVNQLTALANVSRRWLAYSDVEQTEESSPPP
jgi:hypothetical protein